MAELADAADLKSADFGRVGSIPSPGTIYLLEAVYPFEGVWTMLRNLWFLAIVVLTVLALAGCAAGPNPAEDAPIPDETLDGFWSGLWHGFIAPITFIISLFSDNVNIYEVHNNGGWYNFGFLFGASIIFGGGTHASTRR